MEVKEALQKRRSVRKFTEEAVSEEMLDALMHAAMSGPSAVNRQTWEFYVITNPDLLSKLRAVTRFSNIHAPAAIVVCGNMSRALPLQLADFWVQDCSAATMNVLLQATDLGLGTVWCGMYPQKNAVKKLQTILNVSEKIIPLNIIYVGHPQKDVEARDQYQAKYVHRML